jgi:GTPase SAR1 family protein
MDIRIIDDPSWTYNAASPEGETGSGPGIIILKHDMPVFRFLDSSGFDGNTIHKVRVAREMIFGFRTLLKYKPTGEILLKPESFSELILFMDERGIEDYRFVLDTEDKDALSNVIQQLLYLDIDLEVMLRREDLETRKMELFGRMYDDLNRAVKTARSSVVSALSNLEAGQYGSDIVGVLSDIEKLLHEVHERNLKVAVMALKKSGKSVLVNCLLGGEYTPASIELPTFTTCVYRKSGNGVVSLRDKGETLQFDSPEALKNHLLGEFKSMQMENSGTYTAEDMEITYVPDGRDSRSYTVIDTPGPDLAGTRHKDIAYRWIREADVILFIIDYSKHLTESEEEFFRDIKDVFEEYGKFYSLIVVVNKLDLMYLSDEKKSVVRFIDFLRTRFMDLGYKGVIVLGVSALQYFYSLKAARMEGCCDMPAYDGTALRDALDECLLRYQGKDEMTVFSFLDNRLRDLRWFHGRDNATLADLREMSGVPQLMKYMDYISMEKAHVEVFNHKIFLADRKYSELKEDLIAERLRLLAGEKTEIEVTAGDMTGFMDETFAGIGKNFKLAGIMDGIEKDLELARKSLNKVLNIHRENFMKRLTAVLNTLTGEAIVEFRKGGEIKAVDNIFYKLEKSLAEKLYSPVLGKYRVSLNRELDQREQTMRTHESAIRAKIEYFNRALGRDYHADFSGMQLPRLPEAFVKFDFTSIILMLDNRFAASLLKERTVRKRGLLGTFLMLLTFGLLNTRTGDMKFDDIKIKKALFLGGKDLNDYTARQVNETHDKLFEHIRLHMDRLDERLSETEERFKSTFVTVFESLKNDLESLADNTVENMEFLKSAGAAVAEFGSLWEKIRMKE